MIIYICLATIIVFSIITGIITTIIEKKGIHPNSSNLGIKTTEIPTTVKQIKKQSTVIKPTIKAPTNLTDTIEVLDFEPVQKEYNKEKSIILIDETII